MKWITCFFYGLIALLLAACNGSSPSPSYKQVIDIQVAPKEPLSSGVSWEQLPLGGKAQYEATIRYSDGSHLVTTDGVTWRVSNANAAVSTAGMVTALQPGEVLIEASLEGITGQRTLLISDAALTAVELTPGAATVHKGLNQAFALLGRYSDGTSLDLTTRTTWSSSTPTIASINSAGVATGIEVGTTHIMATVDGHSASATLTVDNASLTYVALLPTSETLHKGLTQALVAQGHYSDGSNVDISTRATWLSSDTQVATVNDAGLVTAVSGGSVTITATLDGISATTSLAVNDSALTAIALTPVDTTVPKGLSVTYLAQGQYADGSSADISRAATWHSSAPAIATVDQQGKATGVELGTATITASFSGQQATSNLVVVNATLTSLAVTPATATLSLLQGVTQAYRAEGLYSDGTTLDVTAKVAWASSNAAIASINAAGVATGVAVGTADITATLDSQSAHATVQVLPLQNRVVTWGPAAGGGDSSTVQEQLRNVKAIAPNLYAFAALKADGAVVTWGDAAAGGDSSAVQAQLTQVQRIFSSPVGQTFAALKMDGSVVTWGNAAHGGDSSAVQAQLTNVQAIFVSREAFAALKADGSVVTWGSTTSGGDSSAVQAQLTNVQTIFAGEGAFAALKTDGSVVTWGDAARGGNSSAVQAQLTNVRAITGNISAFAALKADGSVVTWGSTTSGGDSSAVQAQLTQVQAITGNGGAFAALKADGSVVTWGIAFRGGDSSAVQAQLTQVQTIVSSLGAFAALKADGSVVTWGDAQFGGDSSAVQAQLTQVQTITGNFAAFAALKADGSVVTWGDAQFGGDSSAVQAQLTQVQTIKANGFAFAAVVAP